MTATELRNLHRWVSPKKELRKSVREKAMLDRGGGARKSPAVALPGLSKRREGVVNC